MRVELDNGVRFLTNFRYNVKSSISDDPVKDGENAFAGMKTSDYDSFDSDCGRTMVGLVQTVHGTGNLKQHKAQCFYGQQITKDSVESSKEESGDSGVKLARIVSHNSGGTSQPIIGDLSKHEAEEAATATEDKPSK